MEGPLRVLGSRPVNWKNCPVTHRPLFNTPDVIEDLGRAERGYPLKDAPRALTQPIDCFSGGSILTGNAQRT